MTHFTGFILNEIALRRALVQGILKANSKMIKRYEDSSVWPYAIASVFSQIPVVPLFNLLGDGLRIIWTQGIIDGDKVIRAVVLNVEKGELDKYDIVLWRSDLPLTPRLGWVADGVPGWWKGLLRLFSLQTIETLIWEEKYWLHHLVNLCILATALYSA